MDGLANRSTTDSGHKITMKYGGASANYRPKKSFVTGSYAERN
jgi:hypothetical protein